MRSQSAARPSARSSTSISSTFVLLALALTATAQEINNFTGALQIVNGQGTYSGTWNGDGSGSGNTQQQNPTGSVQAQCPANFPTSCTSIQQPDHCCPAGNYCSWAGTVVGCCPEGKTCSGAVQGWYQSTTVYQPPATTVVVAGGGGIVTNYQAQPQNTKPEGQYGYCSTLTAVGPGLPTTQPGACGTILVVEAEAIKQAVLDRIRSIGLILALHVIGGALLYQRG